jgi:hypothetical protein
MCIKKSCAFYRCSRSRLSLTASVDITLSRCWLEFVATRVLDRVLVLLVNVSLVEERRILLLRFSMVFRRERAEFSPKTKKTA